MYITTITDSWVYTNTNTTMAFEYAEQIFGLAVGAELKFENEKEKIANTIADPEIKKAYKNAVLPLSLKRTADDVYELCYNRPQIDENEEKINDDLCVCVNVVDNKYFYSLDILLNPQGIIKNYRNTCTVDRRILPHQEKYVLRYANKFEIWGRMIRLGTVISKLTMHTLRALEMTEKLINEKGNGYMWLRNYPGVYDQIDGPVKRCLQQIQQAQLQKLRVWVNTANVDENTNLVSSGPN